MVNDFLCTSMDVAHEQKHCHGRPKYHSNIKTENLHAPQEFNAS